MIDLYTFATPNGFKVSIALEELALPYEVHVVHIGEGKQFEPAFKAINPNSKIPAITDREGPGGEPIHVFESGAILLYLAEKTGKLLPDGARGRWEAVEWLMFQMAGVGPMFGQFSHFTRFAKEQVPYAIERYRTESIRLLKVMDARLSGRDFLAGTYSVADVATFPWVRSVLNAAPDLGEGLGQVKAWQARIEERPAVQRGLKVPDLSR